MILSSLILPSSIETAVRLQLTLGCAAPSSQPPRVWRCPYSPRLRRMVITLPCTSLMGIAPKSRLSCVFVR